MKLRLTERRKYKQQWMKMARQANEDVWLIISGMVLVPAFRFIGTPLILLLLLDAGKKETFLQPIMKANEDYHKSTRLPQGIISDL